MNHYFQQLLTCSGLARPAPLSAARGLPPAPVSGAEFSEITTEALPTPMQAQATLAPSATPSTPPPGRAPSASAVEQPGIVEIGSTAPEHAVASQGPSVPRQAQTDSPTLARQKERGADQNSGSNRMDPGTVQTPKEEPSAPVAMPTREQLIEHVFRWVGQNPVQVTPPALGRSASGSFVPPADAPSAASAPISAQPSTPAATARPTAATTTAKTTVAPRATPTAPVPPSPATAPIALTPPAPRNGERPAALESTIEILIGTLQIQVEAPPGPAASKPVRRPTAPRTLRPAASAPASQRPAIDLNRLRRGFYL